MLNKFYIKLELIYFILVHIHINKVVNFRKDKQKKTYKFSFHTIDTRFVKETNQLTFRFGTGQGQNYTDFSITRFVLIFWKLLQVLWLSEGRSNSQLNWVRRSKHESDSFLIYWNIRNIFGQLSFLAVAHVFSPRIDTLH